MLLVGWSDLLRTTARESRETWNIFQLVCRFFSEKCLDPPLIKGVGSQTEKTTLITHWMLPRGLKEDPCVCESQAFTNLCQNELR